MSPEDRECEPCNALMLAAEEATRAIRVATAQGRKLRKWRCPVGDGYHIGPPKVRDPLSGEWRPPR